MWMDCHPHNTKCNRECKCTCPAGKYKTYGAQDNSIRCVHCNCRIAVKAVAKAAA